MNRPAFVPPRYPAFLALILAFSLLPNQLFAAQVTHTLTWQSDSLFKQDGSGLSTMGGIQMAVLAAELKERSAAISEIIVIGHSDNLGSKDQAERSTRDQATLVKEALVRRQVPSGRIYFMGMGADFPLGDNATPEGRAINRRIEIRITGENLEPFNRANAKDGSQATFASGETAENTTNGSGTHTKTVFPPADEFGRTTMYFSEARLFNAETAEVSRLGLELISELTAELKRRHPSSAPIEKILIMAHSTGTQGQNAGQPTRLAFQRARAVKQAFRAAEIGVENIAARGLTTTDLAREIPDSKSITARAGVWLRISAAPQD